MRASGRPCIRNVTNAKCYPDDRTPDKHDLWALLLECGHIVWKKANLKQARCPKCEAEHD